MAVIHLPPPAADFQRLPNAWARDAQLSYKAKGILWAVNSHAATHELTTEQLIAESADGRDAVYAGLVELEKAGYLKRIARRGERGRVLGYDFQILNPEEASSGQVPGSPVPENPEAVVGSQKSTSAQVGQVPENPEAVTSCENPEFSQVATGSGKSDTKKTNNNTKKTSKKPLVIGSADDALFAMVVDPTTNSAAIVPDNVTKLVQPGSDDDTDFAEFWANFPRKVGKPTARRAWAAALKRKADAKMIIKAAARYRDDPKRKPNFTCHPSTWLNDERYQDEVYERPQRQAAGNGSYYHRIEF